MSELASHDDNYDHLLKLGKFYMKKGDLDKAERVYGVCIELRPSDFRGHFNLGIALSQDTNRFLESVTLLKKSIELNETLIDAFGALAGIYIRMHSYDEATSICKQVMYSHLLYFTFTRKNFNVILICIYTFIYKY